jgi:hypothetical protein
LNPLNILVWSIPLLIIPASYLSSRYLPLRKVRYYCYALVLAAAFALSLFHVTFRNLSLNTLEFLTVNFIVAEFFWNCRRSAKGRLSLVLVVAGLVAYAFLHWHWIAAGPVNAKKLWKPVIGSTYRLGTVEYRIKDKVFFRVFHPAGRRLTLCKQLGGLPIEKQISDKFLDGYCDALFVYKWSSTGQGVRLDIWHNSYQLWTMGEGF